MSDVSVVGLGAMGSALASTKAEPLVRDGAALAADLSSAVAASPVVLICVDDYEVTRDILSRNDVRPRLSDRVLVQLSTGTPQEARGAERFARECGADYLDGAILAYPDQMGTPEAALLVAGAEATFQRCEPLLRSLAGGLTF